jgi:hypothetical protein
LRKPPRDFAQTPGPARPCYDARPSAVEG